MRRQLLSKVPSVSDVTFRYIEDRTTVRYLWWINLVVNLIDKLIQVLPVTVADHYWPLRTSVCIQVKVLGIVEASGVTTCGTKCDNETVGDDYVQLCLCFLHFSHFCVWWGILWPRTLILKLWVGNNWGYAITEWPKIYGLTFHYSMHFSNEVP